MHKHFTAIILVILALGFSLSSNGGGNDSLDYHFKIQGIILQIGFTFRDQLFQALHENIVELSQSIDPEMSPNEVMVLINVPEDELTWKIIKDAGTAVQAVIRQYFE